MVKNKLTLSERFRRFKRIIRYLHRRGTLFHSLPREKRLPEIQPKPKRKKIWRPWRKIRYLARKGSLLRRKRKPGIPEFQTLSSEPTRKKRSKYSPYLAYRRIRFLINTGRLFSRKVAQPKVRKQKRRTLRKIRYLIYRGACSGLNPNQSNLSGKNTSERY